MNVGYNSMTSQKQPAGSGTRYTKPVNLSSSYGPTDGLSVPGLGSPEGRRQGCRSRNDATPGSHLTWGIYITSSEFDVLSRHCQSLFGSWCLDAVLPEGTRGRGSKRQ